MYFYHLIKLLLVIFSLKYYFHDKNLKNATLKNFSIFNVKKFLDSSYLRFRLMNLSLILRNLA